MPAVRAPAPVSPAAVTAPRPARPAARAAAAPRRAARAGPPLVRLGLARPAGEALVAATRAPIEASLGVDLAAVRVHTDYRAAIAARDLGARAFTYGTDIYLGAGERPTDLGLMAHEAAHVVQQRGGASLQAAPLSGAAAGPLEREARLSAAAVRRGEAVTVAGSTGGPRVQGEGKAEEGPGWLEQQVMRLVHEFAPDLEPILRQGIFEWLKERITEAVHTLLDTLAQPARAVTGVVKEVSGLFADLLAWMRDAAARLARGDCGAVTEAAEKIQKVIDGLASPVIDRVKQLAKKVGDFFTGLWDRFGAPAWDFLKKVGGAVWEKIRQLGQWVWDKTAPVRNFLSRAWTWLKNKLGVGEGPEGQNGLLQWVQEKAGQAWDWIKARIEPIKKPLMVVAGVLVLLSPAGPILAVGAGVAGLVKGISWVRQYLRSRDGVIKQRGVLQGVIIPGILNVVNGIASTLQAGAKAVTEKLNAVAGGLGDLVGAVAGSLLQFAVGLVQWVAEQFRGLADWAATQVTRLADGLRDGLERLRAFLQPLLDFLGKVAGVIGDLLQLPGLVLGKLWNAIPACIRDPFVDFLINQILKRIPIFSQLTAVANIWEKVKKGAMAALRQVFKEGDLAGAALTVFKLLLDVLSIPLDLVTGIFDKAAGAIDLILNDPLGFLKNVLRSFLQGFKQFFGAIGTHLLNGIKGWLFGAANQAGVRPPGNFSLGEVFRFVLDLLDVNLERVFARLEKKTSRATVGLLRKAVKVLTGVWEWVSIAINEGPAGLWRKAQERLGDLWRALLDGVIGYVVEKVTKRVTAKILSLLDPTGVMAVVNSLIALYNAIESFVQHLKEILEVINAVLDVVGGIAQGAIAAAANLLEKALDMALPVVIAFLANQVGLGDIAERIKTIAEVVRAKVDDAIDWLIDKALAGGRALLGLLEKGGAAVAGGAQAVAQRVLSLLGLKKTLRLKNGEQHTLAFQQRQNRLVLTLATNPVAFRDFITSIGNNPRLNPDKQYAVTLIDEIDRLEDDTRTNNVDHNSRIVTLLEELGRTTAAIMNVANRFDVRTTPPAFAGLRDGFGRGMRVMLSTDDIRPGSVPSVTNAVYQDLNLRRGEGGGAYYVRGHLLNEHLGGPGDTWDNLTPLSQSGNRLHELRVESFIKPTRGDTPRAFLYVVTPSYGRTLNAGLIAQINAPSNADSPVVKAAKVRVVTAEQYVPTSLVCSIREIDHLSGENTGISETYTIPNNIAQDGPADYVL